MKRHKLHSQSGMTLVELLISVSMASIIYIIIGTFLATFITQNNKSMRNDKFEGIKSDLVFEMNDRIKWAKTVNIANDGDNSILVVDGVEYRVEDGSFLRDGASLFADGVIVESFEVINLSTYPDLAGLEIELTLKDKNYLLSSELVKLSVSQRMANIAFDE